MITGEHRAELVGYLVRRSSDVTLAEDIAHDAIARLIGHAQRSEVHNPRALLFRIADNLLVSNWRRRRMAASEPISETYADDRPGHEHAMFDRERLEQVRRIIADMPPLRREVLVRRRLQGESYPEIADAMGLSASAVEKHMTRALAMLRNRMSALENGSTPATALAEESAS